ncbi:precorrin-6y C5,15-methyltransferase (decarboxylating) subunit CbiE [[Phormidium] sp. ETS-05]|uniref:precorrin-6y C5,15-methyltransferase (decarboxylating) subunit CbiE n=1 Tax=[Phormidium] sp. ETS-05 TaxID=222819 RepID=UPI0031FEE8C3
MINVVGIGLDGAAGLAPGVLRVVENAVLLVGSDRHLSYFPHHPGERLVLGDMKLGLQKLRRRLETAPEEESIVVLTSGDPLFFGLGRLLVSQLPPETLIFHPHISSVQLAFNRVKVPWQDARVISAHGRSLDETIEALRGGENQIAVLTDDRNHPGAIGLCWH